MVGSSGEIVCPVLSWRRSDRLDANFCNKIPFEALSTPDKAETLIADQERQFNNGDRIDLLPGARVWIGMCGKGAGG